VNRNTELSGLKPSAGVNRLIGFAAVTAVQRFAGKGVP
jgi:hypothetical protein